MTTVTKTAINIPSQSAWSVWTNNGLELLWLLIFAAVPLAIADPGSILSEAVIAYAEIPKVVLLRVLTGLMLLVWATEWAVTSQDHSISIASLRAIKFQPSRSISRLVGWANAQSSRWVVLAVWFFLFTTLLSTVLSGSFEVSLWGEIPAQDGYSFYNVVSYVVLFGVIATHLRTRGQLWRIFGVMVAVGAITGGYAVLQAYSHDFLGLSDKTGGFVTAFTGNTILTAAVLLMTITVSCAMAVITIPDRIPTKSAAKIGLKESVRRLWPTVVVAGLWFVVVAVQMLGLAFTTSRGPGIGTLFALALLVLLAYRVGGWRYFGKSSLLIWLPGVFTIAVVWVNVSIANPLLWLAAAVAITGFFALEAKVGWTVLGRISVAVGVTAAVVTGVFAAPILMGSATGRSETPGQVSEFGSVQSQVLGGVLGGRLTHWDISLDLINNRPWFEFDNLSLSWLRPLIGYGPDLFRATYLLRSPANGPNDQPLEPDHAHNFFIHQTVEQGYVGLLSAIGIFAAVFVVAGRQILRSDQDWSPTLMFALAVLLALVFGRFVEMMVGVARVSDLTILWGLLGVFAAMPAVAAGFQAPEAEPAQSTSAPMSNRRSRRRSRAATRDSAWNVQMIWKLAIVAILAGGIGSVIWIKNINYVRAAVIASNASEQFRDGDWTASLESVEKSIELAPDVTIYQTHRAQLYFAFLVNAGRVTEPACGLQNEVSYNVCVAVQSYESNLNAIQKRPLYYRNHMSLANSAFNLEFHDLAIQSYQDALSMVPNAKSIYSALGEAYLQAGQAALAIEYFQESLKIGSSDKASILLGLTLVENGEFQEGADLIAGGLKSNKDNRLNEIARQPLANAYFEIGRELWESGETVASIEPFQMAQANGISQEVDIQARVMLSVALTDADRTNDAAANDLTLGRIFWENGSTDLATKYLLQSIEFYDGEKRPEDPDRELLAAAYLQIGRELWESGETIASIAPLQLAQTYGISGDLDNEVRQMLVVASVDAGLIEEAAN